MGIIAPSRPVRDLGRQPAWRLAAYASIAFPSVGMNLPLSIFLPPFYAKTLGLGMGEVGLVFMLVRMFDVVSDPVMGIIGDRVESRWGRRRHWLVIGLPFMMLGTFMAFMPPASASALYLGFWLVVVYVGATMLTINQTAWGAELSPNYNERSRIAGFNQFAGFAGSLMILTPMAILEYKGVAPAGRESLAFFGTLVLFLAPVCILAAVTLVGERKTAPSPPIGVLRGLLEVLRNPDMRRLLLADAIIGTPGAMMGATFIFYQSALVGSTRFNSIALIAFNLAHILGVPVWVRTSYKTSKHRTFAIDCVCFALTSSLFFLPGQGDGQLFVIIMFIQGLTHSGLQFLLRSMAADVVDVDNVQTGGQRTGLYFSLLAITGKAGAAVAIGLIYPLLGLVGFNPHGGNTELAKLALRILFVGIPTLAVVLGYLIMNSFSLDRERQERMQREIAARDHGRDGGSRSHRDGEQVP